MKSEQIIDTALDLYRLEAFKREADAFFDAAIHGGKFSDECNITIREIAAYNCGRQGIIPLWLVPSVTEATRLLDPDYVLFLQLQKKFEGK